MLSPRPPLWSHAAGPMFAIAALFAVLLPWAWLLPADDPRLLHLRIGFFGFAAAKVTGYVLTALPAWAAQRPALGPISIALGFLAARVWAFAEPGQVLPVLLISGGLGLVILWPAIRGRAWLRLPIALAPLVLALLEAGIVAGILPVSVPPRFMVGLILLIGGWAIPAFLATEAARQGRILPPPGTIALPFALAGIAALAPFAVALPAALLFACAVLWRVRAARHAGLANVMLAGAWSTLALTLPVLALVPSGGAMAWAEHLFLTATLGGMAFAFSARAAMDRPEAGGLRPRRAQLAGFLLVLAAAPLRAAMGFDPAGPWLVLSGLFWSAGWLLYLSAHLRALPRPAPFPILSAAREARHGA